MSAAEPGGAAGLEDILERLQAAMLANNEHMDEIVRMSDISFRLWLQKTSERLSTALGISLARITAFLVDLRTVALNAKDTFVAAYRNERDKARRVRRIGEG